MLIKTGKILILLNVLLFAGDLNFVASVNRTEVGLGEPVLLTVSVEGEDIGQVPSPQLPALPDFDIGGTQSSQSTSIQMSGGKIVQRQFINFIYTLYPKEIGETFIGACQLEFRGETYRTKPISIKVVKGPAQPTQPPAKMSPSPGEPGAALGGNIKLVATANRKSIYQGEQVIVDYTLYTRLRLADLDLSEAPSFRGFWVEPIFDAQRIEFQRKTIDGKLYDYSVLRKSALFPMTSGQLRITPMKLDVAVLQSPRDFFDFFGTTKTLRLESDPLYIDVKPLPSEGKPEEFTGGVGQFNIKTSLDRTTSEAGEPINLIVRISGSGNIKLLEKPLIPSIPGVKVLEPEIQESTDFVNSRIQGYKEFRYPLIPQTDGEHAIPGLNIAYFDPAEKTYQMLETDELRFTATQTAAAVELAQTGGLKITGADIIHIKSDADNLRSQRQSAGWWLALPYFASLLGIGLSLLYRRHQARLLTDRAYARKLRSSKLVKKRLKQAEQHLKKNNHKEFHAALSRVLIGYISDRYNLDVGLLTNVDIVDELAKRNVSEEIVRRLNDLLNQCDMRFSPGMKCENPQELFDEARELLDEL